MGKEAHPLSYLMSLLFLGLLHVANPKLRESEVAGRWGSPYPSMGFFCPCDAKMADHSLKKRDCDQKQRGQEEMNIRKKYSQN